MRILSAARILKGMDPRRLWANQHERKPDWVSEHQLSWNALHRRLLVERLRGLGRLESILELGCNAGPNLIAISYGFSPPPRLHGIDINARAVAEAEKFFAQQGWTHVSVQEDALPDALRSIPDRSWDCVISIAVLMHLPPGDFEQTLLDVCRIARCHLVFMDLHLFHPFPGGTVGSPRRRLKDRWARNWWEAFSSSPGWQVQVLELPPGVNRAGSGDINALIVGRRADSDGGGEGVE